MRFLAGKAGNKAKVDKILAKKKQHEEALDRQRKDEKRQTMQIANAMYDKQHAPIIRDEECNAIAKDIVSSLVDRVEFRINTELIDEGPSILVGWSAEDAAAAADAAALSIAKEVEVVVVDENDVEMEEAPAVPAASAAAVPTLPTMAQIRGSQNKALTWYDRSMGVFIFLHPSVYGNMERKEAINKTASAIGIQAGTFSEYVNRGNEKSHPRIQKWFTIVKNMTWADVKKRFPSHWAEQFDILDDSTVKEQIEPYKSIATNTQTVFITKDSGSSPKGRANAAKKRKSVVHITKDAVRVGRSDKGAVRKWNSEVDWITDHIQFRWNIGDPATRTGIMSELRVRNDGNGIGDDEFYKTFLAEGKGAQLSKFLTKCIKNAGYSIRKNSIGQTVPDNWYQIAKEAAEKIHKRFVEEKVTDVCNADQTFMLFTPEEGYVIAPTGAK